MSKNTNETLKERGTTHGSFNENARIAQTLKAIMETGTKYQDTTSVEREAIAMICHKLARAVSGNPHYIDVWRDIAGYSELVVKELEQTPGALDAKVEYFNIGDN